MKIRVSVTKRKWFDNCLANISKHLGSISTVMLLLVLGQRQMGNMGFGVGVPVRKVIKNKLVDMNKLASDVYFLAEGER